MPAKTPEQKIAALRFEVEALQLTLGTLITWLAQTAGGLGADEASRLLQMMSKRPHAK